MKAVVLLMHINQHSTCTNDDKENLLKYESPVAEKLRHVSYNLSVLRLTAISGRSQLVSE